MIPIIIYILGIPVAFWLLAKKTRLELDDFIPLALFWYIFGPVYLLILVFRFLGRYLKKLVEIIRR